MRELGVPHLVVAFDLKVEEICRNNRIPVHTDDEGTGERYFVLLLQPSDNKILTPAWLKSLKWSAYCETRMGAPILLERRVFEYYGQSSCIPLSLR